MVRRIADVCGAQIMRGSMREPICPTYVIGVPSFQLALPIAQDYLFRYISLSFSRMLQAEYLERVLHAVGELMRAEGATASIVEVGGASLSLLGLIPRTTRDVDVIARMEEKLIPPDPLPPPLVRAIQTVARDFGLSSDWMNTDVALQWKSGLPPHLEADIRWHTYE